MDVKEHEHMEHSASITLQKAVFLCCGLFLVFAGWVGIYWGGTLCSDSKACRDAVEEMP